MNNPRPLELLYSSPCELLDKAKHDLARLDSATLEGTDVYIKYAFFDCAVSVFHVKDWIIAFREELRDEAEAYWQASNSIKICRDACHANKHFKLDLERRHGWTKTPPLTKSVDYTVSPPVGVPGSKDLKIRGIDTRDDRLASDVLKQAIAEWETFFAKHKIG